MRINRLLCRVMAVLTLVTGGGLHAHAQKYYNLKQVTAVHDKGLYVFEQDGTVMGNTITSGKLNTISDYKTSGLSGSEAHVWELLADGSNFKMHNVSANKYLNYSGSSTNLAFESDKSKATKWTILFDGDNGYIYNDDNRCLGFQSTTNSTAYKAYVMSTKTTPYTPNPNYPGYLNVYELVEAEAVTVSAAGLATYVSGYGLDYGDVEGLKAYRAQVNGSMVNFYRTTEVPAGEGVLLRATTELDEATTFYVTKKSVEAWASDYNDFITGTGAAVQTEEGGNYNYILNQKGGVVGFYQANNQTVATNRAYLQTTGAASRMTLQYDDETTTTTNFNLKQQRIKTNFTNDTNLINNSNVVFDLQGRKIVHGQLSNGQISKGLYIMNGKKVVVR